MNLRLRTYNAIICVIILFSLSVFSQQDVNAQTTSTGRRCWMSPATTRADFWSMFTQNCTWDSLRSKVDVFSLHVNCFSRRDSLAMRAAAKLLKDAGVKVNIECGGLRPFSGCDSLLGEHHAALELSEMQLWTEQGGNIDFISMDSPINTTITNGDPGGTCNWTVQHAANEMVDYMKAVRTQMPNVTFALIEPVPWYSVGSYPNHPGNNYGDLLKVLDTVLTVVAQRGERLEIFHSDSPFEYSENSTTQGWKKIKAVEDFLHSRGIRHGRICNSQDGGFQSDQLFYQRTLDSFNKYKAVGGDPDEWEVWCWYAHPAVNCPESQPYSFTYTCRQFIEHIVQSSLQTKMRLEPADGRVYHGIQTIHGADTNYMAALNDSAIRPLVHGLFISIPGTRPPKDFNSVRDYFRQSDETGWVPEVGLFLVASQASSTGATDSIIAKTTQYDATLDSLYSIFKAYGRRMFLRIGGEFNGPWNGGGYHPYIYTEAFQKIVNKLSALGIRDSIATVWCYEPDGPNDFDSLDTNGYRWYPGDAYVDWFGLDVFDAAHFDQSLPDYDRGTITKKGKSERFLQFARVKARPVFLNETSAKGMTITSDSLDGVHDWNGWFTKFWEFIGNHTEIKGFNYTDQDWESTGYPGWGDARIENNQYILAQYRAEMHNPKYIHLPYSKLPSDTGGVLPQQVILVSPQVGSFIAKGSISFRWKKSTPNVTAYQVQAAADLNFSTSLLNDSTVADTTKLFVLTQPAVHYWHVRARNAAGWGPWSNIWSFTGQDSTTMILPEKVVLVAPANNAQVTGNSVQLLWHKTRIAADRYRTEVAIDVRFRTLVLADSNVTDTTRLFNGVVAGATFYWRVQAHNSAGWGPVSDVWTFNRKDTGATSNVAHITVNPTIVHQTMEGWGASSNFNEETVGALASNERAAIFDLVFKDLAANILCIRLYSTFQTSKGGPYNWADMATQRLIANEALARGQIRTIWLKISSPPGWMKDNGTAENGGHLTSAHYQDYADYLSYYIRHMKSDYTIPINAVSIFNEPGFAATYESSETTPQEYHDILKIVRTTFDRDGLNQVQLIGPEVGSIGQCQSYFTTLLSDTATSSILSHITTHQYGDQLLLYGTGPGDQWDWLKTLAAGKSKSVWESEMYVGGPNMATSDIDEALRMALLIWNAVTKGDVTAWHYWHYIWPDESKANKAQGLIALPRTGGYSVLPRYYAFKHWSNHVPCGSKRIEATSDNPDVSVAAFCVGEPYVTIAFNRSDRDIEATFTSSAFLSSTRHIRSSANENYKDQPLLPAGTFTVTLKAKSISTFITGNGLDAGRTPVQPRNISMDVYPQPARDLANVVVSCGEARNLSVSVFDLLGRPVATLFEGSSSSTLTLPFATSSLPAGLYQLRVVADGKMRAQLLEVVR